MDAFCLNLDVGPDALEVNARLGNIIATYEVRAHGVALCMPITQLGCAGSLLTKHLTLRWFHYYAMMLY